MIYPPSHPKYPNEPKGIKAVLTEQGLYQMRLHGKCQKCESGATNCCNKHIFKLQLDFQQQKSLVKEVIEAAGHLCIFLPKFHCELNFIEFFWGTVKRYLWDNCDYTFETLKENMPKAMSVRGTLFSLLYILRYGLGNGHLYLHVYFFALLRAPPRTFAHDRR
jgi:hypothetical protein